MADEQHGWKHVLSDFSNISPIFLFLIGIVAVLLVITLMTRLSNTDGLGRFTPKTETAPEFSKADVLQALTASTSDSVSQDEKLQVLEQLSDTQEGEKVSMEEKMQILDSLQQENTAL